MEIKRIKFLSRNIIHWQFLYSLGEKIPPLLEEPLNASLINQVKNFKIYKSYNELNRRVTALAWHPTQPNTVAIGSKGGDIVLWNFEKDGLKPRVFLEGIGPGGSIQSLVFDQRVNGRRIFTVSIDGTLSLKDFQGGHSPGSEFLQTGSCEQWYTSLDVFFPGRVILAGNNKGFVNLLTLDGERQWEKKLHKQKVTHIEFSPKEPWCFVTASVDRELKVWDIRSIKDKNACLFSHAHERPINSAYFSRTDGGTLLTTDQYSQLRIYSCPSFNLSHIIHHPHRQFQHLTPIKATWHPLRDIAVVGRYPDPNQNSYDLRTIDFFDGQTGELLYQHFDSLAREKIISLNEFNNQGDKLISGVGCAVMVSKSNFSNFKCREKIQSEENDFEEEGNVASRVNTKPKRQQKTKRKLKEVELDLSKLKKKKK